MKKRCLNPTATAYDNYGGRGITVCERWMIYENYLADMGEPPLGMVIDRIDNNRGYEPDNCRWVTVVESLQNRRCVAMVNGELISDIAKRLGRTYWCIKRRIYCKLPIDQVMFPGDLRHFFKGPFTSTNQPKRKT